MGPSFFTVFGGSNLYPAYPIYINLSLSVNTVLSWPTELAPAGSPVVADIIDVTATAGGLTIQFSDATQVGNGYTALINNIGANTFSVLDSQGNTLAAIPSGQVWQLYLADNSTVQGTWRAFQYGTGVSSATAAALAGAGLKAITTTLNERILVNAQNVNYVMVAGDRASCIEWTGGSGGTITSPNPATVGSDWFAIVKNNGTGVVTFLPASGTIDGVANLTLQPGQSTWILTDGTNFITLGLGQKVTSIFDFLQISLTGVVSPLILSGSQLNRVSYRFIGNLTANMVIQVPNTIQQYWIDNETTGAFSLTVQPSGGAGIVVAQGARNILYCDGTNVFAAVTFGSTGFVNGTVGSPSIFFTASPTTGLYAPAANQIGIATSGVQRGLIDAGGQWTIQQPTGVGAQTSLTINGSVNANSVGLAVNQSLQGANNPGLAVSGLGGFCEVSIFGDSAGSVGTTDFSLFQSSTGDASVFNRALASLFLGTNGINRLMINGNGFFSISAPSAGTGAVLGVTQNTSSQGFSTAGATGDAARIQLVDGNTGNHTYQLRVGGAATGTLDIFDVTAAASRVQLSTGGNVTINAPTSGTALGITGLGTLPGVDVNQTNTVVGNPAIRVFNTSAAGQSMIDYFANANALTNRLRSDFNGNFNYVCFSTGAHTFYTGGDAGGGGTARFQIGVTAATNVQFPTVGTTASAANAFLDNANSNNLLRSTSSLRYKTDIRDLPEHWAQSIYGLRPVVYRSTSEADDPHLQWAGLIAEEVENTNPRLCHYDADGLPDGVQYDRIPVLLLAEVQKLRREVDVLRGVSR